jgi:hypothetical protein
MASHFHGLISSTKLHPWLPFRFAMKFGMLIISPVLLIMNGHIVRLDLLYPDILSRSMRYLQAGNIKELSWRQQVAQGGVNTE